MEDDTDRPLSTKRTFFVDSLAYCEDVFSEHIEVGMLDLIPGMWIHVDLV
jgi:hypothetical protein